MKYKLIKEYPGSPKLEFITSPKMDNAYYVNSNWIQPENYPEFWELVIEKDYEILSYQQQNGDQIYDLQKNGKYKTRLFNINLEFEKEDFNEHNLIISVKRLSDGEIFTIGDAITNICGSKQKISELYIDKKDEKMCVYTNKTSRFSIDNIQKVKQPLFTTEDGVDIFEGDTFYFIPQNFYGNSSGKLIAKLGVLAEFAEARFSTKEKAEEYILMNKLCLSLNDIKLSDNIFSEDIIKDLIKLVKSKIQQSV